MDKKEILEFIKGNSRVEIPALQIKFGISYREAMEIVDGLVKNGDLIYSKGITYSYSSRNSNFPVTRRANDEGTDEDDDDAKIQSERRKYLEERRRELIRRMQQEMQEDEDDDDSDDEEMDEDELRYKALKLAIERNSASVSLFQRTFPIGYWRSCELINWMERMGYVSVDVGSRPRKILITQEEFDKLFNEPHCEEAIDFDFDEDDDDQDTDLDKKFAEYEKFLEKKLFSESDDEEDEETEEDEAYERIINCVFHSDAEENEVESTIEQVDSAERKAGIQNLVAALSRVADKKKAPISADIVPAHDLWSHEEKFGEVVIERIERLIKSDKRMGQKGAVKKAETYLEAVRDTHDRKMVQIYERLVYELKNTSAYLYNQLKKQFFG